MRTVILAIFCIIANQAYAAIRVDVNYDKVETEVSPNQGTMIKHNRGTTFIVENGKITRLNGNSQNSADFNGEIAMHSNLGGNYVASYKFVNGTITEIDNWPEKLIIIKVITNKIDTCKAYVIFRKKPGQKFFVSYDETNNKHFRSDEHAINVSCRIAAVQTQ